MDIFKKPNSVIFSGTILRSIVIQLILIVLNPFASAGQLYNDSVIDIHAHLWKMEGSAHDYLKAIKHLSVRTGGIVIVQRPGNPEEA